VDVQSGASNKLCLPMMHLLVSSQLHCLENSLYIACGLCNTYTLCGCGLDSTGSGQRPVAGCCECGDEPSGSCATELVS
jgi:hypothetical protein